MVEEFKTPISVRELKNDSLWQVIYSQARAGKMLCLLQNLVTKDKQFVWADCSLKKLLQQQQVRFRKIGRTYSCWRNEISILKPISFTNDQYCFWHK